MNFQHLISIFEEYKDWTKSKKSYSEIWENVSKQAKELMRNNDSITGVSLHYKPNHGYVICVFFGYYSDGDKVDDNDEEEHVTTQCLSLRALEEMEMEMEKKCEMEKKIVRTTRFYENIQGIRRYENFYGSCDVESKYPLFPSNMSCISATDKLVLSGYSFPICCRFLDNGTYSQPFNLIGVLVHRELHKKPELVSTRKRYYNAIGSPYHLCEEHPDVYQPVVKEEIGTIVGSSSDICVVLENEFSVKKGTGCNKCLCQ